jgi:anti-sigma factor RsiW
VIGRSGHLKDDHLLDCYVAERSGTAPDGWAADHLSACEACERRYDDLSTFMDDLRAQADQELETVFPAERLAAQQQQILRRLEHAGRPARVISFPGRDVSPTSRAPHLLAPRWIAAAAAAGLFIGVAVGGYVGPDRLHRRSATMASALPPMTVQPQVAPTAVRVNATQVEAVDDDAFLMDLEAALSRPQSHELLPFDALTPDEQFR